MMWLYKQTTYINMNFNFNLIYIILVGTQNIKRRLNYKMYNYDEAGGKKIIIIYVSIVLNLLLFEKHNGVEIYKNLQFKSYFKKKILI